ASRGASRSRDRRGAGRFGGVAGRVRTPRPEPDHLTRGDSDAARAPPQTPRRPREGETGLGPGVLRESAERPGAPRPRGARESRAGGRTVAVQARARARRATV